MCFSLFVVTRVGSVGNLASGRKPRSWKPARHPHGSGAKKEKSVKRERAIVLLSFPTSTCSQPCRFARRSRLLPRSNDGRLLLPLSFLSWFLVNGWKSAGSLPDRETYVFVSGSAFLSVAYAREFHWWSKKRSSRLTFAILLRDNTQKSIREVLSARSIIKCKSDVSGEKKRSRLYFYQEICLDNLIVLIHPLDNLCFFVKLDITVAGIKISFKNHRLYFFNNRIC